MIELILLAILIYSGYKIINWYLNNKQNEQLINIISESIVENDDDNKKYNVNFENLKKQNSDTVAWIKVENTEINFPVVKCDNNDFYLKHNFEKKYNIAGWIFADYRNKFDGTDKNIILYGHNMKNDSMFGTLKNTLDENWYNNEQNKRETYTKSSIENEIRKLGYNMRFYYPLPDYKKPNVIFTDEQLPEYNSIDKYHPYYIENNDITFNEIDVFREILKTDKNMFTFFANSFLIEITKGECDRTYKYISFNNIRKEKYRLITKIADEYVEKQEVNEKAHKHYENIKSNIRYLNEKGIKTVDYIENQIIRSKYIEQKNLLNNRLTELLEEQRNDEFYEILDKFIEKMKEAYHG